MLELNIIFKVVNTVYDKAIPKFSFKTLCVCSARKCKIAN